METEYLEKIVWEYIGNDIPEKKATQEILYDREIFRNCGLKYHEEKDIQQVAKYVKQMYKELK